MRGTPTPRWTMRRGCRFIPAYAGNAAGGRRRAARFPVHPRVCGERLGCDALKRIALGSSPRMRGTREDFGNARWQDRFIPAYAGNAKREARRLHAPAVHPRVCGERAAEPMDVHADEGSSPRMRGTRLNMLCLRIRIRFIPAYAGNASPEEMEWWANQVHPRVCGERSCDVSTATLSAGSSPRMRGTPSVRREGYMHRRFIPAYAGNACRNTHNVRFPSVHPRVCGERGTHGQLGQPNAGSSPRMRGTQYEAVGGPYGSRFIPAYAGNARLSRCSARGSAVHPRVCGERKRYVFVLPVAHGSSPRMRGTPLAAAAYSCHDRFIPAYAGNAPLCGRPS